MAGFTTDPVFDLIRRAAQLPGDIQSMADQTPVTFRRWLSHLEIFGHLHGAGFQQHLVGPGMFVFGQPLRMLSLPNAGSGCIPWCDTAVTGTCRAGLNTHIEKTLHTTDSK